MSRPDAPRYVTRFPLANDFGIPICKNKARAALRAAGWRQNPVGHWMPAPKPDQPEFCAATARQLSGLFEGLTLRQAWTLHLDDWSRHERT
jgi:hypothetical protein